MDEIDWQVKLKALEKQNRILEKKLKNSDDLRRNSDELRNSHTILFQKVNRELEESKALVQRQHREIRSIIQNIEQGILVVCSDLVIEENHSNYLSKLFGRAPQTDEQVDKFMFTGSNLSENDKSQALSGLLAGLGEPDFMFDCNSHQLPREFELLSGNDSKTVEVDWNPIVNDESIVEKVIVTVRDVTELRKLRKASAEKAAFVKAISELVEHEEDEVKNFLNRANFMIADMRKTVQSETGNQRSVEALFRSAHTIKGNARSLGFEALVDVTHKVEGYIDEIRQGGAWSGQELETQVSEIDEVLRFYQNILQDKLGSSKSGGGSLDPRIIQLLESFDSSDPADKVACFDQLFELFYSQSFLAFPEAIKKPLAGLESIARQLGKPNPIICEDTKLTVHRRQVQLLNDVFNHCLRNSVDHGIERPDLRTEKGKPATGTIKINSEVFGDQVRIYLQDDGAGLNLDQLAQAKGLDPKASQDEQIAEVIFDSGVSTAAAVSDISGRGVGMDAVRSFIRDLGGDVTIQFTGDRDESGCRPFRLVIILPGEDFRRESNAVAKQVA